PRSHDPHRSACPDIDRSKSRPCGTTAEITCGTVPDCGKPLRPSQRPELNPAVSGQITDRIQLVAAHMAVLQHLSIPFQPCRIKKTGPARHRQRTTGLSG